MYAYLYPLLAMVVLCGFWGAFQLWLNRVHPESQARQNRTCSGCEEPCGKEALF